LPCRNNQAGATESIIETGIAPLLEAKVVGIDIDIRSHNQTEIEKHPMFKRIMLIEGSSTNETIVEEVQQMAKTCVGMSGLEPHA